MFWAADLVGKVAGLIVAEVRERDGAERGRRKSRGWGESWANTRWPVGQRVFSIFLPFCEITKLPLGFLDL